MSFEPSLVRQALDALLRLHPFYDLVSIGWQLPPVIFEKGKIGLGEQGPWVLVKIGQPSKTFDETPAWALHHFAIWKATGALHTMEPPGGPVSDDPIWEPRGEYADKRTGRSAIETLREFADYPGDLDRTMRFSRREAREILSRLDSPPEE